MLEEACKHPLLASKKYKGMLEQTHKHSLQADLKKTKVARYQKHKDVLEEACKHPLLASKKHNGKLEQTHKHSLQAGLKKTKAC